MGFATELGRHREGRFIVLFALLLVFHVALPVTRNLESLDLLAGIGLLTVVGFAGWATIERYHWQVAYMLCLLLSILSTAVLTIVAEPAWRNAWLIYHAGLISVDAALVTRWTIRRQRITGDTIAAGLSGYYLIGLAWGLTYALIDIYRPGSFTVDLVAAKGAVEQALYFSFVTLTTLGYGDISPTAPLTRSLATAETVLAQVYLAVIVARLVAMQMDTSDEPLKND